MQNQIPSFYVSEKIFFEKVLRRCEIQYECDHVVISHMQREV